MLKVFIEDSFIPDLIKIFLDCKDIVSQISTFDEKNLKYKYLTKSNENIHLKKFLSGE